MTCVQGFTFKTGASELFCLDEKLPASCRRYVLSRPIEYEITTDAGILLVRTEAGFVFDGRSGPSIIDWYAPNLGSLEERVAWHMHDCLGYAQSLDFAHTNLMLKYWLHDMCGYRKSKAEIIRLAVSLSDSWYGVPMPGDPWYSNISLVQTEWRPLKQS